MEDTDKVLRQLTQTQNLNVLTKKMSAMGSGTSGLIGADLEHESVLENTNDRYVSKNAGWRRLS